MGELHRLSLALAVAGMVFAAPLAQAVPFKITSASFTPGSGYGVDTGQNPENGGTLLDVVFSTTTSLPIKFDLNAYGQSQLFDIGTVNFREQDSGNGENAGIKKNQEDDDLGVTLSLTFETPLGGGTRTVSTVGTAYYGLIADTDVDFELIWTPVSVNFTWDDWAGIFDISLASLSFTAQATKAQTATISLRQLNKLQLESDPLVDPPITNQPGTVPEPGMFSLLGLGLVGLGLARRRKAV